MLTEVVVGHVGELPLEEGGEAEREEVKELHDVVGLPPPHDLLLHQMHARLRVIVGAVRPALVGPTPHQPVVFEHPLGVAQGGCGMEAGRHRMLTQAVVCDVRERPLEEFRHDDAGSGLEASVKRVVWQDLPEQCQPDLDGGVSVRGGDKQAEG